MPEAVGQKPGETEEPLGKRIIERLEAGELPQMVDWFDPGLLAKVGVRSVISATLGQYTDQRLIQASTDIADEHELIARYDYSGLGWSGEILPADPMGAVWVDYIADLGDGFEATYAMAYLMAAEELAVKGAEKPLPAGQLLLMGGDQVYPDATKQEYADRLRDPYDWAFSTQSPTRKVFAIPGNHDWYDGLSAFSALFCSSRDRISGGVGTKLGGWRCHQHRSYFAIRLPHDWWIWGPDIQLADNLDDSQRDYFDLMADQTKPGDNIILCLAEPSWHHQSYDNLHEISMLARKKGAKICAVIAGDWHHYSRYTNDKLGTQFITSGGGGAFAHSTHGLKERISLKWASRIAGVRTSSSADTEQFNRIERAVIGPGGPDFTQNPGAAAALPFVPTPPEPKPGTDSDAGPGGFGRRAKALRKDDIQSTAYDMHAPAIYPPRWTSRMLSLRNLLLPFRNRGFTMLVGIVYFVFAWVWVSSDPRQSPALQKIAQDLTAQKIAVVNTVSRAAGETRKLEEARRGVGAAAGRAVTDDDLARARESEQEARDALHKINERIYELDRGRHANFEDRKAKLEARQWDSRVEKYRALGMIYYEYNSLQLYFDPKAFLGAAEQSPMFAFLLLGLLAGLIAYAEFPSTFGGTVGRVVVGSLHFLAHVATLLLVSWLASSIGGPLAMLLKYDLPNSPWPDVVRILVNLVVTLGIGGILGGFVMGIYWTVTCALFDKHTGDAFGALGIKDYKNFLRIKLEPGRCTIYPVALDKVPGRRGWTWQVSPGHAKPSHDPQIMPRKPLEPRLIEPPIVIEAANVQS